MSTGTRRRRATADVRNAPVVLSTKLHIPSLRPGHVPRPMLIERLGLGAESRLTLLAAPPGWGKTTLLAEWHAHDGHQVDYAWVSIDPEDNDPARFWTYVSEAARSVDPELADEVRAFLRSPAVDIAEVVLPALINGLARRTRPLRVVLDDYHVITNPVVHATVTLLVERGPPNVRVVMATRSDPPLPLGRLRARHELNELRAEALRFTADETASLLTEAVPSELDPDDVRRIHDRTEGWAAGLYLLALSLRGQEDTRAFVSSVAGDDRHIVDYLGAEVLDQLDPDVRSFLIRASVLEEMCGPLCDAVLERKGSAALLDEIERANLFVVPLGGRRRWYRNHNLFGELLRNELEVREPGIVADIHIRAALWFLAEQQPGRAISHALLGGDDVLAAETARRHWIAFFNEGRLATVTAWLDALPAETVAGDTRLCLARSWISLDTGRLDDAGAWLDRAQRRTSPELDVETAAALAVARTVRSFKAGDLEAASASSAQAFDLLDGATEFDRTVTILLAGVIAYWRNDMRGARTQLERAAALASGADNKLGVLYALGYLALIEAEQGHVEVAGELVARASDLAAEPVRAEHFVAMMVELARGTLDDREGRIAEAAAAYARAVALSGRGGGRLEQARALLALAGSRAALGDAAAAAAHASAARKLLSACRDAGTLAREHPASTPGATAAAQPRGAESGELSERELEVLRLLPTELSQREIGQALYVSLNTVKTHTRNIFRKLDVDSRIAAVARARELDLI